MADKGQHNKNTTLSITGDKTRQDNFVLEKNIFSNIFEKDIRRVFIYKKAERLAKAIHLITPAFVLSPALRGRIDGIAVGLVDAAILPPASAKDRLSRELLTLSSILSIARTGGLLSAMNADLITKEAHLLLQEVAAYEEPHLFFEEVPTLAGIEREAARGAHKKQKKTVPLHILQNAPRATNKGQNNEHKGQGRKETVLGVLREKGNVSIKDISRLMRGVSEKTVQRELQSLVEAGVIKKTGERRWSTYAIA